MDSLALLCNLYGDGPATLRRLRMQGVLRIEDLAQRNKGELAAILALPPATARRFLKEASALRSRVLEHADVESERAAAPTAIAPERERVVLRGKEQLLDAAALRWQELERTAPSARPHELKGGAQQPVQTALQLAALDRSTHEALRAAGMDTLEQLVAADSEALARAAQLGSSQVLYAQSLARRRLRERPAHEASAAAHAASEPQPEALHVRVLEPAAPPRQKFSPSERAPREWLSSAQRGQEHTETNSAGPFA
jgi:hypothetical protein